MFHDIRKVGERPREGVDGELETVCVKGSGSRKCGDRGCCDIRWCAVIEAAVL